MADLSGVLTAMVTPFDEDGGVDLSACRRLAAHLLESGSDGLVLTGTTGESPTLDDEEKLAILTEVRAEVGEGPTLIAGTGSNDTRHTVELTRAAAERGADAALVVTPYYNKPNRAGVHAHFEAVAGAVELPVIVYNIPSRCVVNIPPDQLAELAGIENVVAVKQANDDELGPVPGLELLAGNDDVFLRCLELGGAGGILVASHLAGERMAEIRAAVAAGDSARAAEIDSALRPLYEALSVTTNPIPVKTALAMVGLCSDRMRLPLVPASAGEREAIREALADAGLLSAA
jgi:4-hydroxy-tetrahydrodipicolinate synthase